MNKSKNQRKEEPEQAAGLIRACSDQNIQPMSLSGNWNKKKK